MNKEIEIITQEEIKRIVSERKAMNISQSDVAKFIGVKQQTISKFENKYSNSLYIYMGYVAMIYSGKESEE